MKLAKGTIIGGILLCLMLGGYIIFPLKNASDIMSEIVPSFRSESGFRGFKWGASPSEHEIFLKSDFELIGMNKFYSQYRKKGEKLTLGDFRLTGSSSGVKYTFLIVDGEEKFCFAQIFFNVNNEAAFETLTEEYGPHTGMANTRGITYYSFENEYVKVFYEARLDYSTSEITIESKEMRTKYGEFLQQSEETVDRAANYF